jgi:hypothetical protein
MDATKPCKSIGFGAMDATKTYKFIRFGAMDGAQHAWQQGRPSYDRLMLRPESELVRLVLQATPVLIVPINPRF